METAAPIVESRAISAPHNPRWRLVREVLLGYVASWLVGIGFGFALKQSSGWTHGFAWERDVLVWFHAHPLPFLLDQLMLGMPYVGTNLTILPFMLLLCPVLWRRYNQKIIAVQLFILSIGSLSLNPAMKTLLARPRPDLFPLRGMWTWASYPSGHVILTPALYFTVSMMLYRSCKWRWPFALSTLIVLLTCYSRLYLSVHWPTDLIGGLLIGITWLFTSWRAFHGFYQRANPGKAVGTC